MSYIPDCREDKNYNEKYLGDIDSAFVRGYDYAVEQIVNLIENNSNVYPELDDILDYNKAVACVDKKQIVKEAIEGWAESERNELITSMIDSMDDAEYEKNKAAAKEN